MCAGTAHVLVKRTPVHAPTQRSMLWPTPVHPTHTYAVYQGAASRTRVASCATMQLRAEGQTAPDTGIQGASLSLLRVPNGPKHFPLPFKTHTAASAAAPCLLSGLQNCNHAGSQHTPCACSLRPSDSTHAPGRFDPPTQHMLLPADFRGSVRQLRDSPLKGCVSSKGEPLLDLQLQDYSSSKERHSRERHSRITLHCVKSEGSLRLLQSRSKRRSTPGWSLAQKKPPYFWTASTCSSTVPVKPQAAVAAGTAARSTTSTQPRRNNMHLDTQPERPTGT